jgi:hypothetical protein
MNKKTLPNDYPKTADEWWMTLDYYKGALRNLIATYHPVYGRWAPPARITAHAAEMMCDTIGENVESHTEEDPLLVFDEMVENRNRKVAHLLSETWFGLPESTEIRQEPGFFTLCDLCSEAYVLYDEDEEMPE